MGLVRLEAIIEAGVVVLEGLVAFRRLQPEDWAEAMARVDDLVFREGATETTSLFATEYFVIFGPLYQLGMGFYVALAVLGWVAWLVARRYEPGWLLVGTYAAYLLVLAGVQVRFAGQLAIPLAVLTGLGVVQLLAVVDLARTPAPFRDSDSGTEGGTRDGASVAVDGGGSLEPAISIPDGRKVGYALGIGLLMFGLSLIYVPGLTADVTHGEAQVAAAGAIDDHAEATNRTYPANFVLSEWGDNRLYNYLVNGESQGYGYAQSNYGEFRSASDPDSWYDRFNGRVGYVVVTDVDEETPAESAQAQLLEERGAGGDDGDGLAHYQAVFVDNDVAAFAVVPGATLEIPDESGETVTVETAVSVSGESFTYERKGVIEDNGRAAVTVPYAGEYTVGNRTVRVSDDDVLNGSSILLEE